jgi:hypothetical protein
MICSACGVNNPKFAKFCGSCGVAQAPILLPTPPATQTHTLGSPTTSDRTLVDLKRDILAAVDRPVPPTADSQKNIDKSSSRQIRSARQYIRAELMRLMVHFARLDQPISAGKSEVFLSLYGLLDPPFSHYTTDHGLSFLNEFMRSGVSQGNVDPLEKSLGRTCMERHDRINGTHFFEETSPLSRCRSSDGKVRWQFLGRGKD